MPAFIEEGFSRPTERRGLIGPKLNQLPVPGTPPLKLNFLSGPSIEPREILRLILLAVGEYGPCAGGVIPVRCVEELALGSLKLGGHGQRVGQEPFPWQW